MIKLDKNLRFLLLILLSLALNLSYGQHSVKGKVFTDDTQEPVPFANVLLYELPQDTLIQYGGTDLEGNFVLSSVPKGWYRLQIDFIGMQPFQIDSLAVFKNINLGRLTLQTGIELEEVVIQLDKPETELKIDRKTFNVAQSQVSAGGTATDVLNTLPSVDVDEDGTVSLRGNSNLRILIDGKPTGLSGSDIGLVLKQIPANTIEDIEIITVPSAKYDAESAGGIINIILKKNARGGKNGALDLTWGTLDKVNSSVSLGHRTLKWDISGTYGFNGGKYWLDRRSNSTNATIDTLNSFLIETTGWQKQPAHLGKINLAYRPDTLNEIALNSSFSYGQERRMQEINYEWDYTYGSTSELRKSDLAGARTNWSSGLFYKRDLKNKSFLKFMSSHVYFDDAGQGDFFQEGEFQDENDRTWGNEFTQNVDLSLNLKPLKLELGGQQTHREIENDFVFNLHSSNTSISNLFNYKEDVTALYVVAGKKNKSWDFSAGYRVEYTHAESENRSTNLDITRFYFNHFPSLSVLKKINKTNQLGFNYSKRITRPNAVQLNPSPSLADPYSLYSGNANLIPATNDVSELTWINKSDQMTFSTTAFYQLRLDRVRRVRFVTDEGISTVQWVNYKREDYYGLEFFINYKIGKMISTNFTINIYERLTDGSNIDPNFVAEYFGWDAKLNTSIKLPKSFSLQLIGEYKSRKEIVVGTILPRYFVDASIQKLMLKERAKLSVRLTDVFDTRQFLIKSSVNNWDADGRYKRESRILFISFNYNLFPKPTQ